jgi:hypothetical protein
MKPPHRIREAVKNQRQALAMLTASKQTTRESHDPWK